MLSLICAWINAWVNNREAGDLRRYRPHCDVTVMNEHGNVRFEDLCTRRRYLWHGWVITPHGILWDAITYSCPRYLFLAPKLFNTLRPRQNGRHFPDDIFKCIFLNEKVLVLIKMSLKFVPKCSINNIPALVQIMAWRRPGDKPLSEPMIVSFPTHIYVTRPQWVNYTTNELSKHFLICPFV